MNEKLITVTGKGCIHATPDITRLILTLKSLHDTYDDAYAQASDNSAKLNVIMKEASLPTLLPKTILFDIEKKTQREYDKYGNYKSDKFIGFELNHKVKIDLNMDTMLLNKVVTSIGKYLKQAEINIEYIVKDPQPFQLKMLERAIKDAKEKASIMAKACGCKLGPVKDINYSVQEIHIYSQARFIHCAEEAIGCNMESLDITPDDLTASDEVTVKWQLITD